MKKITFINADTEGLCRAVRACYGKCGFTSFLIGTGYGITGVAEVDEDS